MQFSERQNHCDSQQIGMLRVITLTALNFETNEFDPN